MPCEPAVGLATGPSMTAGPGIRKRPAAEREALATRVRELDADVLCLQQVEDDAAPAAFDEGLAAEGVLEDSYPYRVHAPSHDLRVAGIGTLSRLPLGQVSTWSHVLDGDSAAFAARRWSLRSSPPAASRA